MKLFPIAQSKPWIYPWVPPTRQWRFVSACNRTANQVSLVGSGSYQTTMASRVVHYIGSGDVSVIRLLMTNFTVGNSGVVNPGNTTTYNGVYLESLVSGTTVQFTFSAATSITLADGEPGVLSDPIYPSAFGLSSFAKGTRVAVRSELKVPLNGTIIQASQMDSADSLARYYNPGATACSNLSGTGALTYTGTAPTATYAPPSILIGKFVSGDPRVWLGQGTSILDGSGDTVSGDSGVGFFSRAMMGLTPASTALACLNMGKPSGGGNAWVTAGYTATTQFYNMLKYCNSVVLEYGTNNFDGTANGSQSNRTAQYIVEWGIENYNRIYANYAEGTAAFKILHTLLMPRCQSAGFSDASPASQTVLGPKWDIGGDADLWNVQMTADVGAFNRTHYLFDPSSFTRIVPGNKSDANFYKWVPNSTNDGTHPGATLAALYGSNLRAYIDTL